MSMSRLALLCVILAFASLAGAQTTYRWIDKATGQTVFSDQPPPPGTKQVTVSEGKATGDERQLPYATRIAAEKYPVTLYTSADCAETCANARALLNGRGIPFTEMMVKNQEEAAELTKQMGTESFIPGLKVGPQNHAGYESGAWNNLLDLAGYPKTAPYGSKLQGAFSK